MKIVPKKQLIDYAGRSDVEIVGAPLKVSSSLKVGSAGASISSILVGTVVADVASIADGAQAVVDVTVSGAALGDIVLGVGCSVDVVDLQLSAHVDAADSAVIVIKNDTGGAVDLASATFSVAVLKVA